MLIALAVPAAGEERRVRPTDPAVTLTGAVTDPTGAVVPGATVVAHCGDLRREAASGSDGT